MNYENYGYPINIHKSIVSFEIRYMYSICTHIEASKNHNLAQYGAPSYHLNSAGAIQTAH